MQHLTIKIFEENGLLETQFSASGNLTEQRELLKKAIDKNSNIDKLFFSIVLDAYKSITLKDMVVKYTEIKPNKE